MFTKCIGLILHPKGHYFKLLVLLMLSLFSFRFYAAYAGLII